MKKRSLSLWLSVVCIAIIVVLWGASYLPFVDPTTMDLSQRFLKPSLSYPLGTDQFGRNTLYRIMFSMRSVLSVGIGAVSVGSLAGVILGAMAGMLKGIVRMVILRIIDGLMAIPGMLLAMMLVVVFGKGTWSSIIAIAVFMIPTFAKLTYSIILETKAQLYIKAARSYGLNDFQIVRNHMFYSLFPRFITQFSSSIAGAIMVESSLSFLGLGIQPPHASLGMMLNEARQFFLNEPFLIIPSGIVLMITVIGFSMLGDVLNDRFIERSRS